MIVAAMSANIIPSVVLGLPNQISSLDTKCRVQLRHHIAIQSSRRDILLSGRSLFTIMTLSCVYMPSMALAAEKNSKEEDDKGVIGAIESLLDPNEKTKSGRLLPKAYLKSAREVIKTLRESLNEDPKNNAKFRRTADAAKESIQDYLLNWRGQPKIASEKSHGMLEQAIRSLAGFYKKAGPSAPMPEDVKSKILDDLSSAEESL